MADIYARLIDKLDQIPEYSNILVYICIKFDQMSEKILHHGYPTEFKTILDKAIKCKNVSVTVECEYCPINPKDESYTFITYDAKDSCETSNLEKIDDDFIDECQAYIEKIDQNVIDINSYFDSSFRYFNVYVPTKDEIWNVIHKEMVEFDVSTMTLREELFDIVDEFYKYLCTCKFSKSDYVISIKPLDSSLENHRFFKDRHVTFLGYDESYIFGTSCIFLDKHFKLFDEIFTREDEQAFQQMTCICVSRIDENKNWIFHIDIDKISKFDLNTVNDD